VFETAGFRGSLIYDIAAITYMVVPEPVSLLNSSYAELGDPEEARRYVDPLQASASDDELRDICGRAAVHYVAVFTDEATRAWEARGLRRLGTVDNLDLSPYMDQPTTTVTLFELPWRGDVVSPATPTELLPNRLAFEARAGQQYDISLTAFAGWRAYQTGRRLPVIDTRPGMSIVALADGPVTLEYRYRHYWSR
jgi:hypothetical protein